MSMFSRHVSKRLSAYCNKETDSDESRRIAEHLVACGRCRAEYEQIELGTRLAARLPMEIAPEEIWTEVQRLVAQHQTQPQAAMQRGWWTGSFQLAAVAAVLVLALAAGIIWYRSGDINTRRERSRLPEDSAASNASWAVEESTSGANGPVKKRRLAVGGAFETSSDTTARVSVGEIGHVDLEPNTRVRLIEAQETEHRLALDRGTLHATISAPPRIFFVDTPSAEAIDLGCAYTLKVDDQGRSFLHVTSGWVALVRDGVESYVPMGAMCQTRPPYGPGTPYFEDASAAFVDALARFDFETGASEQLTVLLAQARDKDTFTLWHLLQRVDDQDRRAVLNRMIALVGLPKGVTRAGIMRRDQAMLDLWKDELDPIWFQ